MTQIYINYSSYPHLLNVISSSFDVFPQTVVIFDYTWRENVVSVTGGVMDFKAKGAAR